MDILGSLGGVCIRLLLLLLLDYLVKATVKPPIDPRPSGHGDFFQHRTWVCNPHNHNVFKTQTRSKNCAYLIFCQECGKQYVSETKNSLLTRFTQHSYIFWKNNTHIFIVQHFILHHWSNLRATVLETILWWSMPQRRSAEKIWIQKLGTTHPGGLKPEAVKFKFYLS